MPAYRKTERKVEKLCYDNQSGSRTGKQIRLSKEDLQWKPKC
jgi:hypothetical protein